MYQILESQQTPHTSPLWVSYGVSIVKIWEKIYHLKMALHCICIGEDNGLSFVGCVKPEPTLTYYQMEQHSAKSKYKIFIQENAFGNFICKISAILLRSQRLKPGYPAAP